MKCFLPSVILFSFAFLSCRIDISAATKEIQDLSLGSVISVNGVKFVKIDTDGNFIALQQFTKPGFADGMYMQDFTATMCNNAPTPIGTDYFLIGTLKDKRDNKQYEVRKFADGKCWMVDNLAYGGDTASGGVDGCLKTTFDGNTNSTPTHVFGPGTFGDCRYPYANTSTPDINKWGYLYNWQAVVQNAQAYQNSDYQPVQPTQGICPSGWHVPEISTINQFQTLYTAAGSPGISFWQPGGSWQGTYAGNVDNSNNTLSFQGVDGFYSSSTQGYNYCNNRLHITRSQTLEFASCGLKTSGLAVRCVKNSQEPVVFGCANPTSTMQAWNACGSLSTPTGTNYTQGPCLMDERDGKTYQVRKFADGNCWMVNNLAYGGADLNNGIDGCLKTTFCGNGYNPDGSCISVEADAISTVGKIAPGLYGDCRYPYNSTQIADTNKYGYFYSWQAAVQDAEAYSANDYQPPQPTQGICPDGWYLPTGGRSGQFQALFAATGSPQTGFFQPNGSWDGVYAGDLGYMGVNVYRRDENGSYWSSSQGTSSVGYALRFGKDNTNGSFNFAKHVGFSIRCLKTP